ncbi:MAG TPA: polyprenyl synthetase family protein, partial [Streptosporangiaceae bacterium]|nr:polyprenyl synthetase family protein [Streptosporangiaceae bacterium]
GRFGAQFAGCPPEVVAVLMDYGERIGVAFQLADDLIDLASESGQSGKTPGTDLREGVPTLPMLHALRMAGPGDARLVELLSKDKLTDQGEISEALRLLRAHPAMDRAMADVRDWVERARRDIRGLPDVAARGAFEAFSDFVIQRSG